MSPVYGKLGAAIAKDPKLRNRVLIAKVDADAHRSLGEKFGVRGFPTLKVRAAWRASALPTLEPVLPSSRRHCQAQPPKL